MTRSRKCLSDLNVQSVFSTPPRTRGLSSKREAILIGRIGALSIIPNQMALGRRDYPKVGLRGHIPISRTSRDLGCFLQ